MASPYPTRIGTGTHRERWAGMALIAPLCTRLMGVGSMLTVTRSIGSYVAIVMRISRMLIHSGTDGGKQSSKNKRRDIILRGEILMISNRLA